MGTHEILNCDNLGSNLLTFKCFEVEGVELENEDGSHISKKPNNGDTVFCDSPFGSGEKWTGKIVETSQIDFGRYRGQLHFCKSRKVYTCFGIYSAEALKVIEDWAASEGLARARKEKDNELPPSVLELANQLEHVAFNCFSGVEDWSRAKYQEAEKFAEQHSLEFAPIYRDCISAVGFAIRAGGMWYHIESGKCVTAYPAN